MCALAADLTLSSNTFVRASSMSCTSLSRRSCWAGESDCSRGLTCALWDTNAFSSLRRRKPPMLYSGAKGTMTPNHRLQRTALTAPPLNRNVGLTGIMTKRAPKIVALDHDEYSAKYVGRTADGRQFFLTTPFVPARGADGIDGREFLALYLFDEAGRLLDASIADLGCRADMDESARVERRDELLASLG